jgi:predicted nucleic acid-binding protein
LIVVDASAAFAYLVEGGMSGEWARAVLDAEPEWAAPHVIDLEVTSVVRRRVLRSELKPARARSALIDFSGLPLARYPSTALLSRIWALRSSLAPYDAAYVVLSEALDAPLLTTDSRLARSHGHRAKILAP